MLLTPGFEDELEAIRLALEGVNVLSVGSVARYVAKGTVLGFDVVAGRPKILVNLRQAKRQNVNFDSELLKISTVIQ